MAEPPDGAVSGAEERLYLASQWQLIWLKFRRHRLAIVGGSILALLYLLALLADFVAPYSSERRFQEAVYHPPSRIRVVDQRDASLGRSSTASAPVATPTPWR